MAQHPALRPGNVAVITGGAGGIGLAAAHYYKSIGMEVCIADIDQDNKRMRWAMQDLTENRPPLSRWHPDYQDEFEAFMRD